MSARVRVSCPSRIRVGSSGDRSPRACPRLPAAEAVAQGAPGHLLQLGVEERLAALLRHHEAQIRLARSHQVCRLIRGGVEQGEVDAGKGLLEALERLDEQQARDDVAGRDGERPLAQLAQGIEIGLAELQLVDGALGALQQPLPRLGQTERAALHQLDPGRLLQVLEVQADVGLGHVQLGGGLAEVLQPGQGDEGVQPVNVQHGDPLLPRLPERRPVGRDASRSGPGVDKYAMIIWLSYRNYKDN